MEKLATEFVLFIYNLTNITEKVYSPCKNVYKHSREAYVFHNKEEYYQYFLDNNIMINNKELLDLAILSNLKNGDIIVLKNICDYIIYRENKIRDCEEFSFDSIGNLSHDVSQNKNIKGTNKVMTKENNI